MTDTGIAETTVQTLEFDTATREGDNALRELFLIEVNRQVMGNPPRTSDVFRIEVADKEYPGKASFRAILLGCSTRPRHIVFGVFRSYTQLGFMYDFNLPFSFIISPVADLTPVDFRAYFNPDLSKHRRMVQNWPELMPVLPA